ncbi:hypothetical protein [Cobetia crustatorum]|uniref:hypothetical protein n=1 Tax=Cobetia crustatorum TaxID=553385 RepID=UPI0004B679F3|nr:hypothetical protein [Cobetia crustatorum]
MHTDNGHPQGWPLLLLRSREDATYRHSHAGCCSPYVGYEQPEASYLSASG